MAFGLAEEDREGSLYHTWRSYDGAANLQISYRFKRVCFGLLNVTWFTQRQMQEALESTPGCEGIYPFVDDVVIAADTIDEMVKKLDAFMKFCADKNKSAYLPLPW